MSLPIDSSVEIDRASQPQSNSQNDDHIRQLEVDDSSRFNRVLEYLAETGIAITFADGGAGSGWVLGLLIDALDQIIHEASSEEKLRMGMGSYGGMGLGATGGLYLAHKFFGGSSSDQENQSENVE